MSRVCIFIAEGFEEVEALTVVDLLRRASVEVCMVSTGESLSVCGRSGITVMADALWADADAESADMLILPGGMPGVTNLGAFRPLTDLLCRFDKEKRLLAAICAGPTILGKAGILQGRRACCYPGREEELLGAEVLTDAVVIDGHITTSRGLGTAVPFALALIGRLTGEEAAKAVAQSIVYND